MCVCVCVCPCSVFFSLISDPCLNTARSEVNAGFFYKSASDREAMVVAERRFIDDRVDKIIALKKKVCDGTYAR